MSYYDSLAKGYDELHKDEQLRKLDIILKKIPELPKGPVLDVGCGTGFCLDIVATHLERPCHGIEPSKEMINQYQGEQEIIQASAEEIPFPDLHFAAVISVTAIQNFSDIIEGVSEMKRVAKIGATIIVSCLKKSSSLGTVAETLAEHFTVFEAVEEDKDIIFVCQKERI